MTLPTVGGSEDTWGTILNAHINVGHSTDGTHNQEDWTPASYAGEESITLPNGLIMKQGSSSIGVTTTKTITFGAAFSTAVVSVFLQQTGNFDSAVFGPLTIHSQSTTIFKVRNGNGTSTRTFDWFAIGY